MLIFHSYVSLPEGNPQGSAILSGVGPSTFFFRTKDFCETNVSSHNGHASQFSVPTTDGFFIHHFRPPLHPLCVRSLCFLPTRQQCHPASHLVSHHSVKIPCSMSDRIDFQNLPVTTHSNGKSLYIIYWLVVYLPLWKMMELVSWDYDIIYIYIYMCGKVIKAMFQSTNQIQVGSDGCGKPIPNIWEVISISPITMVYII